jgi:hypothetical protein
MKAKEAHQQPTWMQACLQHWLSPAASCHQQQQQQQLALPGQAQQPHQPSPVHLLLSSAGFCLTPELHPALPEPQRC